MNSPLDFVHSLQEMKKSQSKWASLSLLERAEQLQALAQQIQDQSESLAQLLSKQENLPFEFVLKNEVLPAVTFLRHISQLTVPANSNPKPTGLISVILPELFAFRLFCERLAAALLAGNGVYVLCTPGNSAVAEWMRQILKPDWPVRIFQGDDDLAEVLILHPGVAAVSFLGKPDKAEKTLKLLSGTWKKWQITGGYHNSALILSDADLSLASDRLVESCFVGMGELPWNISTIYVSESQLAEFQNLFVSKLQKTAFASISESNQGRVSALMNQLKAEKAQVLFGGQPGQPLVVEDLSHCSVLQQDCLAAPVVLISPVKYAHEMVKWTNTSYFGMSAQIFGSAEKVEKMASQLEVSGITANSWIESMSTLPMGIKQSFSGIPGLDPFGGFFSDLRKIDGLASK